MKTWYNVVNKKDIGQLSKIKNCPKKSEIGEIKNMTDPKEEFKREVSQNIEEMSKDLEVANTSLKWLNEVGKYKYPYNFSWLGRPILQLPTDIMALQELIWQVKPDLIIETGIAHGGSLIFSASMLELLGGEREIVGIDIDIREHNRIEIENHAMSKRITMIEGSSIDDETVMQVKKIAENKKSVMILLDSYHTEEHVLRELEIYSEFVSINSYLVVFDTIIEYLPDELCMERPWGVGNNPWTAVQKFLSKTDDYIIDKRIQNKLLLTAAVDGYLKRIK